MLDYTSGTNLFILVLAVCLSRRQAAAPFDYISPVQLCAINNPWIYINSQTWTEVN